MNFYILDQDNNPVEATLEEWSAWYEAGLHLIQKTPVSTGYVSTVMLGFDHAWDENHPHLFETMVFGVPAFDDYQIRYSTYEEAVLGHLHTIAKVQEAHTNN